MPFLVIASGMLTLTVCRHDQSGRGRAVGPQRWLFGYTSKKQWL